MTDHASTRARSWLFTPATRPDRFAKAFAAGADVAILDLEDAVALGDKAQARTIALDYLADDSDDGVRHALRINGLDTRAGIANLDALLVSTAAPDFLVPPKTETAGHLQILDRLLAAAGRDTRLIGLIESAHGLAAIAAATPRLAGLMLGAADMAADLGSATTWAPLAFARGRLIAACALAGVTPIDAPFFDLRDEAGLNQEVAAAVALGFAAKATPKKKTPTTASLTCFPSQPSMATSSQRSLIRAGSRSRTSKACSKRSRSGLTTASRPVTRARCQAGSSSGPRVASRTAMR